MLTGPPPKFHGTRDILSACATIDLSTVRGEISSGLPSSSKTSQMTEAVPSSHGTAASVDMSGRRLISGKPVCHPVYARSGIGSSCMSQPNRMLQKKVPSEWTLFRKCSAETRLPRQSPSRSTAPILNV